MTSNEEAQKADDGPIEAIAQPRVGGIPRFRSVEEIREMW